MYKIQANASGTRSIEVSDLHLETLQNIHFLTAWLTVTVLLMRQCSTSLSLMCAHCWSRQALATRTCSTSVLT